jgi:hypothetical protein
MVESSETLEAGARPYAGFDFARVRVHRGPSADKAIGAMASRAYTFGDHVFLPRTGRDRNALLGHELGHVVEQAGRAPSIMRAPSADPAPATYIIVYGSGRLNPGTPFGHNVGQLFKRAAETKKRDILKRLGKNAAQSTIVFEYAPTEKELTAILNRKYALPVKEIHVFSHGYQRGLNLGGPDPGPGKIGQETQEGVEARHVEPGDLGAYDVTWADAPAVVLYGCNTGAGAAPIAQAMSDEFGVEVVAPTKSTHFQFGQDTRQVPDTGGRMAEFKPSSITIDIHLAELDRLVTAMARTRTVSKGFMNMMKADAELADLRARIDREVVWLNRALSYERADLPDRAAKQAEVAAAVARVRQLAEPRTPPLHAPR